MSVRKIKRLWLPILDFSFDLSSSLLWTLESLIFSIDFSFLLGAAFVMHPVKILERFLRVVLVAIFGTSRVWYGILHVQSRVSCYDSINAQAGLKVHLGTKKAIATLTMFPASWALKTLAACYPPPIDIYGWNVNYKEHLINSLKELRTQGTQWMRVPGHNSSPVSSSRFRQEFLFLQTAESRIQFLIYLFLPELNWALH